MKQYNFSYTNGNLALKLLGYMLLSQLVIFLLFISGTITPIFYLILFLGSPMLIYWINWKKYKKYGSAIFFDSYAEFTLNDSSIKIIYSDIEKFTVSFIEGTTLKIKFKNGEKFKLECALNIFSGDILEFDAVCKEFKRAVTDYNSKKVVSNQY